jgi:zinc transport system permease protein
MLAVAIVITIRIVGLILVIALLTIPPYIAERYAKSLAGMMVIAGLLSALFTLIGLWLSYAFNLTSGASIILVAGVGFLLSLLMERWLIASAD